MNIKDKWLIKTLGSVFCGSYELEMVSDLYLTSTMKVERRYECRLKTKGRMNKMGMIDRKLAK